MIVGDAHWADPTSLEAFGQAVDQIASLRVLLIVTFRPEFEPRWIGPPHVTALTVNRLAERDVHAMIDHVVGNKLLLPDARQNIIERADAWPGVDDDEIVGGARDRERIRASGRACPSDGANGRSVSNCLGGAARRLH
jgi:hypothetical protein